MLWNGLVWVSKEGKGMSAISEGKRGYGVETPGEAMAQSCSVQLRQGSAKEGYAKNRIAKE